jgi:N-acetylglutamate synthase-like GNAT family acetyltransferase
MGETITIREARPEDLSAITELCAQLGYPADAAGVKRRFMMIIDNPSHFIRIASNEAGDVIGWVHALPVCYLESEEFIEIGGLVVDGSSRKQGAGRQLMLAVEVWARESGVATIRLRSNVTRREAHQFYQRIGYQIVKEQYTFVKEL